MVIALILCAENDLLKATFLGSCVSRTQSQGSDFGQWLCSADCVELESNGAHGMCNILLCFSLQGQLEKYVRSSSVLADMH